MKKLLLIIPFFLLLSGCSILSQPKVVCELSKLASSCIQAAIKNK